MSEDANVNVTWGDSLSEDNPFRGRRFPCPLCGLALDIRISRRAKPYCHCDACGIQLFFRGKDGIKRLRDIVESEVLIGGKDSGVSDAITLYNRLEQLKAQKTELESKQGFIFTDADLDRAIAVVETEIGKVREELDSLKPDK